LAWTWWWLAPILLITLVYQIENWRGERAWQQEEERLRAQGESLNIEDYLPKPLEVPAELNAAKARVFLARLDDRTKDQVQSMNLDPGGTGLRALPPNPSTGAPPDLEDSRIHFATDARFPHPVSEVSAPTEILQALTLFDSELVDLHSAAHMPYSRFPTQWSDGIQAKLPHLDLCMELSTLLQWRACSRIANKDADKAVEDLLVMLRLAEWAQGPNMLCLLVETALVTQAVRVAWFGIASQAWTEQQLTLISIQLKRFKLGEHALISLRGERGLGTMSLEKGMDDRRHMVSLYTKATAFQAKLLHLMPRGWLRQTQVDNSQILESMLSVLRYGMLPEGSLTSLPSDDDEPPRRTPLRRWLSKTLASQTPSTLPNILHRTRQAIAYVALAQAAIAVELHRRKQGTLPDSLPPGLPRDPVNGGPLNYKRLANMQYRLWSVAENEVDDGGKTDTTVSNFLAPDWVWFSHISAPPTSPQ
jgi:hypothetical protein